MWASTCQAACSWAVMLSLPTPTWTRSQGALCCTATASGWGRGLGLQPQLPVQRAAPACRHHSSPAASRQAVLTPWPGSLGGLACRRRQAGAEAWRVASAAGRVLGQQRRGLVHSRGLLTIPTTRAQVVPAGWGGSQAPWPGRRGWASSPQNSPSMSLTRQAKLDAADITGTVGTALHP